MRTYRREPDEECVRSWTYRFRESAETGENCLLPFGQCRSSHRFLSSKTKQQGQHLNAIATKKTGECKYHQTVAVGLSPRLFKVDHNEEPHTHDVPDNLKKGRHRQLSCDKSTTKTGTLHHPVVMLCPFNRVTVNSVEKNGSKNPKLEEVTFCRHRFRRCKSNIGYSTSLQLYPLPK